MLGLKSEFRKKKDFSSNKNVDSKIKSFYSPQQKRAGNRTS